MPQDCVIIIASLRFWNLTVVSPRSTKVRGSEFSGQTVVVDVRRGFVKMFRGLLHWCRFEKSRDRTCPDYVMMFVRAGPAS
jgi:hypothetical protein